MRISHVRVWKEDLELSRPYTIAYRTISAVENIFVYIQLDDGRHGIGAGSPAVFVTGELIDNSLERLQNLLPERLQNRSILEVNALVKSLREELSDAPAALAAVDIALHDLLGQYLNLPLTEWWGRVHEALPTSVTIGIKDLDETLSDADEFRQLGFRHLKLKTGHDVEQDIETCQRLRRHIGTDMHIRVDANQGYSPEELEHFFRKTDGLNLELVEQPLSAGEYPSLLQLPERYRLQCAADEDLHNGSDAVSLASDPLPYGIYNIKLMKCGGPSEALLMAGVAERAGIDLMWGCNDESIVSIAAALHVALSSPATRYLDLDGSLDLARDLVEGGFRIENGLLYPTDRPGLGVKLLQPVT